MLSWWTTLDTWIVVTGALSAMSCALVGSYLVLRRMSMMGDAISHAVLPGLAIAFIVTGTRDSLPMFIGAVVIGVITALLIQLISRFGKIEEGTSMGVVFTALFAAGLLLIERAAHNVDLDPGCVLYGFIELTPLNTIRFASLEIPQAVLANGGMFLLNLLFVGLFYKELKVTSFDPDMATSLGINANVMHYVLMSIVAATTVAAFQSVGSILVIAMLIVPAAVAWLFTDRLLVMLLLSQLVAIACALFGHMGAVEVPRWFGASDTSTAGMMAAVAGFLFLGAWVLAPRYGLAGRAINRTRLSLRILRDDILGYLYRGTELSGASFAAPMGDLQRAMNAPFLTRLGLTQLKRRGRVERKADGYSLTSNGLEEARKLIRAHRLWEGYLVGEAGLRPDHVHGTAEQLEHITSDTMRERLYEETGSPEKDPHQKPIPEEK